MKNPAFFLIVTFLVLSGAGPAAAGDGPQARAPETSVATPGAQLPIAAGGKMAFVDPTTGRATGTPSAEQRAAMKAQMGTMFSQSDEGTYDEFLANGAVLRDLQGRFMNATVVRIAPDGSQHLECTTIPAQSLRGDAQAKPEPAATAGEVK